MVAQWVLYPKSQSATIYLEIWYEWYELNNNRVWWATLQAHEQCACNRTLRKLLHDCIQTQQEAFHAHGWPIKQENSFSGVNQNAGPRIYSHEAGIVAEVNHPAFLPYIMRVPQLNHCVMRQGYLTPATITGATQGVIIATNLVHTYHKLSWQAGHTGPINRLNAAAAAVGPNLPSAMLCDPAKL